ncbi:MAG: hypothetical protein ACOYEU_07145 [Limnochordia bacterium]|jgi:hypothetical protein
MGWRTGLISLVLGSLLAAACIAVLPYWLGWPVAVLWLGLRPEMYDEGAALDLTWCIIGTFLPLYYAVL